MTNWKQFKNWLEKEVIVNEELVVKIKQEKRDVYGELSEKILTDFCDSLEATLDNNRSYHLFPNFNKEQDFRQLFNEEQTIFGKNTNQKLVKGNDYDLLERMFSEWRIVNKISDLENELKILQEKYEKAVAEKAKPSSNLKDDEKLNTNLYEEKNNEILQLKRRLKLLEESRDEMVSNREEKIEELEKKLQDKDDEINWLKEQLQQCLGSEYENKIEVNYPKRF